MAVLEAMACSCPVVISHQCNLPEVGEAKAGLVIQPTVEALSNALSILIWDKETLSNMGENGRKLAREKFDWNAIGYRLLNLCKELVGG